MSIFYHFYGFILTFLTYQLILGDKPCIPRKYHLDSFVCVCNATYCDEISTIKPLKSKKYVLYTTNLYEDRFVKTKGVLSSEKDMKFENNDRVIRIKRNEKYQKIKGFGGSFTDASGINILDLSNDAQEKLINSYFGKKGIEFNMGRVPIGGTDFSRKFYTYNEYPEYDMKLSNFSLQSDDLIYKIPIMKRAQAASKTKIHFMATAWDCPLWMKRINPDNYQSHMDPVYYQTWADYHIKFFEEYHKHGLEFMSMTAGNEGGTGIIPSLLIERYIGWTAWDQAEWIANHLGPTLRKSKFRDIDILVLDDQRYFLPFWLELMAQVKNGLKYVNGVAIHWYVDKETPTKILDYTHELFPNIYLISNEACISTSAFGIWIPHLIRPGSWDSAEQYALDIIEDLNFWHVGWMDWNLALDMRGGPNWLNNFADSSVFVDRAADEFLKQPTFYAIGHFSKFIPRNSVRIGVEAGKSAVANVALLREDGGVVVVLCNKEYHEENVTIYEIGKGYVTLELKPKSIYTLVYW